MPRKPGDATALRHTRAQVIVATQAARLRLFPIKKIALAVSQYVWMLRAGMKVL